MNHTMRQVSARLLAMALAAGMCAVTADAVAGTPPAFRLQRVTVLDAKTVDATFSNPLQPSVANLSLRVFHAPHWDHDSPHSHEATGVVLHNEGRTARVSLDRALHSEDPPCDNDAEPRCSDDELPFVVRRATDIYGQVLSNDEWDVWAVGSDN